MRKSLTMGLVVLMLLSMAVSAGAAQELTKVRIATLPYFDYTGLVAAHALGLDQKQGLDFEFVPFPLEAPAVQALMRGSIDIAQGALGSLAPILPQAPDLRVILNNVQFKGFVFVGREGEVKAFDQLMEEFGGDFDKAQAATLNQFKGKTILLVKASFESMLKSTLEQVGLSMDDVTVLDFQNDSQAAVAFLRGVGDLYTGSLPQEIRILKEPGYVAVAGNEALGPNGLWFSNSATTQRYLENNRDTVMKVIAVYYRLIRYMYEKPQVTLKAMVDYLNDQAAAGLTVEDAINLRDNFEDFATIQGSINRVYNPESATYWRLAMENFINQNEKLGKIKPGSVDVDNIVVQEELFFDLLENGELLKWVQSPIK